MSVFVGAVFPLLINTYEGVRNADRGSGYRANVMFVGVLILTGLSLALTFLVKAVEEPLTRWRPEAAKTL